MKTATLFLHAGYPERAKAIRGNGPAWLAKNRHAVKNWALSLGLDADAAITADTCGLSTDPALQSRLAVFHSIRKPMIRIIPAIRTAPRATPTIVETIDSIRRGGFESPIVFAEPDSLDLPDTDVFRWPRQLGPYRSFVAMSEKLLEQFGDQWFLLCEDDIELRHGVADYVRAIDLSLNQILSLYMAAQQEVSLQGDGCHQVTGDVWGSLCYLIHGTALRKILTVDWHSLALVDRFVSHAAAKTGVEILCHRPPLCDHTGATSTIRASRTLNSARTAKYFNPQRHKTDLVTLITPTGDRPEAFALSERWMASQRYSGPVQWIVVDDGETKTKCTQNQQYLRNGPRLYHTLCRNLRTAMPEIRGEYIFVIEDDEYYGPDYLSVMVAQLQHADYVGERGSKYYWPAERKWIQYPMFSQVALCRLGMTSAVLETFRDAITGTDHRSVDERIWNKWQGSRRVWIDETGSDRLGVGIKGMPGRKCGVERAPLGAIADDDGSQLVKMLGSVDSDVYRKRGSVPELTEPLKSHLTE